MRWARRPRAKDERGFVALILTISLVAIFSMATLAVDAGSLWTTRRQIVTGTDAAALEAARMFSRGTADPCTAAGLAAAETSATTLLHANHPSARHSATETPAGFEVTLTDPSVCGTGAPTTGRVRFDGRLHARIAFAGVIGFNSLDTYSSSVVQWGYVTSLTGGGLRPWTVCDQSVAPQPVYGATSAPYPHFALWNMLHKKQITQAQYDAYYDIGHSPEHPAHEYPTQTPSGEAFLPPANGGGVVHRINAVDNCGGGASWRGWIDYDGDGGGANEIEQLIRNGYDGTVSLSPVHECTPGDPAGNCAVKTGNNNGVQAALDALTCPAATPTAQCKSFPVVVNDGVSGNGNNASVDHVAFLWVVLRGHENCLGNDGCEFLLEFVDVQAQGTLGPNPSGTNVTARGTQLCGVDHDTQTTRCDL